MIHGDEDQTASPEAARRFAQTFGARLIQVPGGDHSLSGPGMPQLVSGGPGVLPGPLSPQHSSMPSTWASSARRVSSSVTCLTPKYNFFIYYREKTIILQLFLPVLS